MNALRRYACLLLVLVLLLGGYPPATRASAPAPIQSLAQPAVQNQPPLAPLAGLESGIDCGCNKTGQFLNPVSGKIPKINADWTSPKGTYRLQVSGSDIVYFIITKVADNSIVLSDSAPGGHWGFSPDDNRFTYWYVNSGVTTIRLYNLEAPGGGQLTWTTSGTFIGVEILFSPTGQYFFLAFLNTSNNTRLLILDAKSGVQRYTNQFNFVIIPGDPGDNYGLVGYGFSPDSKDRTFVYSFATDPNTISWNVISLKTGAILHQQNINLISAFWQFTQCGDRLGLANQPDAGHVKIDLFKTLDGSPAGGSSPVVLASPVEMETTLASHLAHIGGTEYTLGSNTAPASCPVEPTLDTISLDSASIMGGSPVSGTVGLNVPAPTGGTTISLASSKPGVAAVPPTVTIPAGSRTASFSVTTVEVTSPTDVSLSASLKTDTLSITLHVLITQPVLTAITPSSTIIKPGETLTLSVSLSKAAPTGGMDVSLSCDHPALIQTPATVKIPAGKSSVKVKLVPVTVSDTTHVTLRASLNNVTKTTQVTLLPPPPKLEAFQIKPSSVIGGHQVTGVITLTKAVPAEMVVDVNLSTTNPDIVSIFAYLRISQGDKTGTFWITTHGVSETINATVTAALDGITRTSSLRVQPADLSGFSFDATCSVVLKDPAAKLMIAGYPINSQLSLNGAAPPAGAVIHLESSNPDLIQVPATVLLPADYDTAQAVFPTRAVAKPTLVTLTASYRDVKLSMPITLTLVPTYTVTRLPFAPVAINDAGQIAGKSSILDSGVITDVNLLVGGDMNIMAMNEHGDILAWGQIGGLDGYYYIDKTKVTPIYTFEPGTYQYLYAEGMNDQNEVVGSVDVEGKFLGLRWKDGVTTTLQTTPDRRWSQGLDINNHGVVVGWSMMGDYVTQADLWVSDLLVPLGLDPWENPGSGAMAVNDAGTIAIQSWDVLIWKDGGYSHLPFPNPKYAHGVDFRALNEKDEVLMSGNYYNAEEQPYEEPMIHNQHGTYYLNCAANLEDGTKISDATDLNNLGQIVGTMEVPGETEPVGILLNQTALPAQKEAQIFLPLVQR